MSLFTMKPILNHADRHKYGVGAFNLLTMEGIKGAIRAAEELNSPIIMQLAEVQLNGSPMEYMIPMMIESAKRAKVPVAVHFDHGLSFNCIVKALKLGCTSVMYDGASLPFKENIKRTKEIVELAHAMGTTCEAELGMVGEAEKCYESNKLMLTDVNQVKEFVHKTNVDALAVAIGNAHGAYKQAPNLQIDRLIEIDNAVETPLVLHGGSGISTNGFRECIENGIQKINVATALQQSVVNEITMLYQKDKEIDYFKISNKLEQGFYKGVKEHMEIFKSVGKAMKTENIF